MDTVLSARLVRLHSPPRSSSWQNVREGGLDLSATEAAAAKKLASRTRLYQLHPFLSEDAPNAAKEPKDVVVWPLRQPLLVRTLQSKEKDKDDHKEKGPKDDDMKDPFGLKKDGHREKGDKKKKTTVPTRAPTKVPTISPTPLPTADPTWEPTFEPTLEPSNEPTTRPTRFPTPEPTVDPSLEPTPLPSRDPTLVPTELPTLEPTFYPTRKPRRRTRRPTAAPTLTPQPTPVMHMTEAPTIAPTTLSPTTTFPSEPPSWSPSGKPTVPPSLAPSDSPSDQPSLHPSIAPSGLPSQYPSDAPSAPPSIWPSQVPSMTPSRDPSRSPTFAPSPVPSPKPTVPGLVTIQYSVGTTAVAGGNRRRTQTRSAAQDTQMYNVEIAHGDGTGDSAIPDRHLSLLSADSVFQDAITRSTREVIELKTSYIVMRDGDMTQRHESKQVNVFENQYMGKSDLSSSSSAMGHQTSVQTEVEKVVVLGTVDEKMSLLPASVNSTLDGTSERLVVQWWYASMQYGVFMRTSNTRRETGTGTSVSPDGSIASETTNVTVSFEGVGPSTNEEVNERVQTAILDAIEDGTLLQLIRLSDENVVAVATVGNEHLAQTVPIEQVISRDWARYRKPLDAGSMDSVRLFGIGLFVVTLTSAFLLYRAAKHRQAVRARQEMWGSRLGPEKEVNEFLSIGLVMEVDAAGTATDASTLIKSDERRPVAAATTTSAAGGSSPDFSKRFVPKFLQKEEMGYSDADSLLRGGFEKTTEIVRMPSMDKS